MSEKATKFKNQLMKMPEEHFETLTFGEVKEGKTFISFPLPGDNSGHGGFKRAHYLFRKTGNELAINTKNEKESHFHESTPVILVE
ncbi:MAG: hypothetical protein WCL02_06430 [bacterium]